MWRRLSRSIKTESALAWVVLVTTTALSIVPGARSQTLTTLYNFQGGPADGEEPCAVTAGSNGSLFGTTYFGGVSNFGTVFKVNANSHETVLHSFTSGKDGESPCARLAEGSGGTLYGTAIYGGQENGTVFRIQSDYLSAAYDFPGGPLGSFPSGVIEGPDGSLYGATSQGGGGQCAGGCGTIFKLDRLGRETVLYTFQGPDGASPASGVIFDEQGNLYGTTVAGGTNSPNCPGGCGTVFRLGRSGKFTTLHKFTGGAADGWFVANGVVRDKQGNLYGTTGGGGPYNAGTIYEITPAGEKLLYSFEGAPDGAVPEQIVRAANGDLFGVTDEGGSLQCTEGVLGCGTVFELDATGRETVLYRFNGIVDGAAPVGPVVLDSHGNIYGTTAEGIKGGCSVFSLGCGTVWKLALGVADIP
jgi:uncharacterized repeat protein (TIGR03803 family)